MNDRQPFFEVSWTTQGTWLVFCLGLLLAAGFWQTTSDGTGIYLRGTSWRMPELCMSRRILGLPCPGCGLTRSMVALVQGHWIESIHWNLAGPVVALFLLWQCILRSYCLLFQTGFPNWLATVQASFVLVFLCALITNWVRTLLALH